MPKLSKLVIPGITVVGLIGAIIGIYQFVLPWWDDRDYPQQLTQDQINGYQDYMRSEGFKITQPLTYLGKTSDYTRQYSGELTTTDNITHNWQLFACKTPSDADAKFSNEVSHLRVLGYHEDTSKSNEWIGSKITSSDDLVGAGAMEATSSSAPYVVWVVYAQAS